MRSWMIAFSLGILLAGFIPHLPKSIYIPLFFIPALLSLRFNFLRLLAPYCLGLVWFIGWAQYSVNHILPKELEKNDHWVRGYISDLPRQTALGSNFTFNVDKACSNYLFENCESIGSALDNQNIQLSLYELIQIEPGQYWQFKVRLKRPNGFLNPGGFDYEASLWEQGIRAVGYVRKDNNNHIFEVIADWGFDSFRYQFKQKLIGISAGHSLQQLNLLLALSIGDRQGISAKDWELISAKGTNHLVVISGMHVGFVAFLAFNLSKFFFKQFTSLTKLIPAQRFAALMALVGAYVYAEMAGFGLPAQRAFIMIAAFMLGHFFCRHSIASSSYCFALALVLAFNPLAPISAEFCLSFAAVGILLFCIRKDQSQKKLSFLGKTLLLFKTQCYIFLGLLPLMLIIFQQTSFSAPLVNLFAIPYITLLIVPLCLLVLVLSFFQPFSSHTIFQIIVVLTDKLVEFFVNKLIQIHELSADALIQLPAIPAWQSLVLITCLVLALHGLGLKKGLRIGLLLGLSPMLLVRSAELSDGEFELHVLDVGQGLASVIRTHKHVLLYDLGPKCSEDFNAGKDIVLPFLRSENIIDINSVILSHGDNDHAGGLAAIIRAFPTAKYISSDALIFSSDKQDLDIELCRKGQKWEWDDVIFEVLHPNAETYTAITHPVFLKLAINSTQYY